MQKNETGPLSYTVHKNKFKMVERPKCKTSNHRDPKGKHSDLFDINCSNLLLDTSPEPRETKAK